MSGPAAARLAAELEAIRSRSAERIAAGYPQTRRCTSGYNLRALLDPQPNLARLLTGSEGSLALFTELEVTLDPRPAVRMGAALTFDTLRAALDANVAILATGPSAVEFLDLEPLRRSPNLATFRRVQPLVTGGEQAMLTVEYQGSEEEARAGLDRLRAIHGELGVRQTMYLEDAASLGEAAALRRAVLPLLMGAPGAERPAAFVEDTVVAPERLSGFVADLQRHPRRARRARLVHRPRLGRLPAPAPADRPQDGEGRGGDGRARPRGRAPGGRLPRRHLRRARLRALALVVPAAALRARAVRGVRGAQARLRPAGAARSRSHRRRAGPHRGPSLRAGLPRPPPVAAATLLRRRGRLRPGHRALLRRRPVQEAHRHHVPAGRGHPRRGPLHPGPRQCAAGARRGRGADRRPDRAGVRRGHGHLRGLQGLQDGVPGRRGHGGAEGRVAGGAARAPGRAHPGARDLQLPAALRAGVAVRAAHQRGRAHAARQAGHAAGRRGAAAAGAGHRPPAVHAPRRARRSGRTWPSSPTASSSTRSRTSARRWCGFCAPPATR